MDAHVLFLGKNGIQEEALKNLVLSGVGVTLANNLYVNEDDVKYSFLLRESDLGNSHAESLACRLREMVADKRRVNFITDSLVKDEYLSGVHSYKIDESIIEKFEIISFAAEDYAIPKMTHVNNICRLKGVALIASMGNGTQGFLFQDLIRHTVLEKISKEAGSVGIEYRSFHDILSEQSYPDIQDASLENLSFMIQLSEICNRVGGREADVISLYKMRGKCLAITNGILGGYLGINSDSKIDIIYAALEIRKFITKQHETIPRINKTTYSGVSLEGCNTPEDVVRRVAQLEVYGKEYVDDEVRKSSPTFQTLLNDILAEKLTTYRSKRGREKTKFIQELKGALTSEKVDVGNDTTDEDIIRLASEQESRERILAQLPPTKPCNEMSQRIDSYRDEADSIFAVYRNIKDDKILQSFISQVKDELDMLSVDHKDCEKPEELINRLAYGRVFPQEKEYKAKAPNVTAENVLHRWNNATIDDMFPFSAILGDAHGIFGVNGGILDNVSGMSDMLEEDGLLAGSLSVLKDIAKMFGVNIDSSEKKRIVFENQDTPIDGQLAAAPDTNPPPEEAEFNDDELQPLFAKVKQTNDKVLLEMFMKSAKVSSEC
ncbi:ubiquitin activating enzyme, putative [Babesia ovata]|uniref:Ubiquitin activating enzyme, putative n=1 Tax=Babesia ovata TaxID=189622 RepID=A0A2H6KI89_9APIC|nr:ubiquitin activating enzyme, putative [Babesia ovata]GBE62705.1 ubiquitin activating enzyme, putative [Babesia ovata]